MPKQTVSRPPEALLTILRDIDAARPALAVATPERQRLGMTAWIARARAAQANRQIGDRDVREVARVLQALGRTWWPGSTLALAATTPPQRVFPAARLRSWDAVAVEAEKRCEDAVDWSDDAALLPRPHRPAAMLVSICATLSELGGALEAPSCPSPAVIREAAARVAELRRIAAELRWLRGCVAALPWAAAVGRLRGLVRGLGQDGATLAALLDPAFTPSTWARHLGRDPQRDALLASVPGLDDGPQEVLSWLLRAFDGFDNPHLLLMCRPFAPQILALRPELASRRHRRRLAELQRRLTGADAPLQLPTRVLRAPHPSLTEPSSVAEARELYAGRRALFISNRSFPELEARLRGEIGVECEAIASVDAPRRRQALLQRIRAGTYDLVLVAHGFSGHADTELFAEACRSARIQFCAVGKGRFTHVVSCLLAAGLPRRSATNPDPPHPRGCEPSQAAA